MFSDFFCEGDFLQALNKSLEEGRIQHGPIAASKLESARQSCMKGVSFLQKSAIVKTMNQGLSLFMFHLLAAIVIHDS